jgi:hypothetical protein
MTQVLFRPDTEQISVCLPPVPQPEPEQGYDQGSAQPLQVAGAIQNSNKENYVQIKQLVSELLSFAVFRTCTDRFLPGFFFLDPDPDVKTVENTVTIKNHLL